MANPEGTPAPEKYKYIVTIDGSTEGFNSYDEMMAALEARREEQK